MKPPRTGVTPSATSGSMRSRVWRSVSSLSGVARPCSSSVRMQRRASTCRAGTPRASRTCASRRDESCSPKETTKSCNTGSGRSPRAACWNASSMWPRATARTPLSSSRAAPASRGLSVSGRSASSTPTWRAKCSSSAETAPAPAPPAARSKAASSASVKRLIAETTTTGAAPDARSARTSAATRSKARASSTDVPPNFITVVWVVVTLKIRKGVLQPKNTKGRGKRQPARLSRARGVGLCFRKMAKRKRVERGAGPLVIIGGAEDREGDCEILHEFVRLAGGRRARLVIISVASDAPQEVAGVYERTFLRLGARQANAVALRSRAEANDDEAVAAIEAATGVFFTGGNQLRITRLLGGTRLDTALHRRRGEGLVVAGTSAGAAMMSSVMIVGSAPTMTLRAGVVELGSGLGLLPGVLIDQHFEQRGRLRR